MDILIKNATIITCNAQNEVLKGDILIKSGKIARIAENIELSIYEQACVKVIEGKDLIAMPGLINAHTHCGQTVLRSFADDLPLYEWLFEKIFPAEEKLTKEMIYFSSLLGIAEMLKSGTTMFFDMYFHEDMTAKAVQQTGIKAVLSRGLQTDEKEDLRLDETKELIYNYSSDKIKVFFGPHSVYTCSYELLEKVAQLAQEFKTGVMIHLSESENEVNGCYEKYDMSPVKLCNQAGLFDTICIAAHCVYVDDEDIEIMAEKNVSCVYNPTSNLKLGNGFAPVQNMIKSGVNVAIGTDSAASNNNLNMLEEMHIASLLEKGMYRLSDILNAQQILKMATVNAAIAAGINKTGVLQEGFCADIVLLKANDFNMLPCYNPISNVVYSSNPSNVYATIVDGQILYMNGKLFTLDEEVLVKEVKSIEKFLRESV
ncbi:amidohydrolase [Caldicellulosiruptor acetigenus I77R1B]|uniref:5-methylthioadenosine/S-adenosylhomocysteine deaminase n=1 Tax=Caldicellulosiruptor acetigenus (strain ATCC 700853 / DSM 12137 / I77R1B) TaxID=632335 RepID=E4SAB5_CALA7|nr:amidohydrolase [Caldicellulosiruptor acetigenus]ADQ40192.1 amidohydrolase [Caldicellulosiruptor acetigenus I77R1B]